MEKRPLQFGLKTVFAAMTGIAIMFGVGLYRPTETVVVVVCVLCGAMSLFLNDRYGAESRYLRSRRHAITAGYALMVGSVLGVVLGAAALGSGDSKGWGVLFASMMFAGGSLASFRTARTRRPHWLEIAFYAEQRKKLADVQTPGSRNDRP